MIYDCFTFFNELELLELRLNELAGVVDKFVLVEATQTHTNKPKPLHYHENRARFSAFHDKIIHVIVDDMPQSSDPWIPENFQRKCIARGLTISCSCLTWTKSRVPAPSKSSARKFHLMIIFWRIPPMPS